MSQRIFAIVWLILCGIGLYIGWGIQSEYAYEPLGPRPFPIAILSLMALCAFILLVGKQEAIEWPKAYVLRRLVLLILSLVIYAWVFEWLGFPLSTSLLTISIALLFGATPIAAIISGPVLGITLFMLSTSYWMSLCQLATCLIKEIAMETWMYLSQGFEVALIPQNLVIALIGCFIGTVVGMLPGLGPVNGVAILLPLAFALKLPAESALILLATVYLGCEYGGRISSILLNVPGDAAAIMTTLDGYPMAKQGKGGVALSISAVSSFIGSTIAIFGIILFAPLLAQWALAFGPAEYFALMVFAIACLGSMMSQNPVKSLLAALIGLAFATVGVDANSGEYRFTFNSVNLSDGIQFIVLVIGLFSVSEILLMLEGTATGQGLIRKTGRMLFNRKEAKACAGPTLRSSLSVFLSVSSPEQVLPSPVLLPI